MPHVRAARSVFLFSLVVFVTALWGASAIDFVALVVLVLAVRVERGDQRATRWALVVMAYYVCAAIAILIVGHLTPDQLRWNGQIGTPAQRLLAIPILTVAAAWGAWNIHLLRRLRRSADRPL